MDVHTGRPRYTRAGFIHHVQVKPNRKKEEVVRKDEDVVFLDWAPGVPASMLFVYQSEPPKQNPTGKDWNLSTGSQEMFEYTFHTTRAAAQKKAEAQRKAEAQKRAEAQKKAQRKPSHSAERISPVFSSHTHFIRDAQQNSFNFPGSGSTNFIPLLDASYYMPRSVVPDRIPKVAALPPQNREVLPDMYHASQQSQHHVPALGQSASLPTTRCSSPGSYSSLGYQFPSSYDPSRNVSPTLPSLAGLGSYTQAPLDQYHNGSASIHSSYTHPLQTNQISPIRQDLGPERTRQVSRSDVPAYILPNPNVLHPYDTSYHSPGDHQPFGFTSDGRRHSLPSIPDISTPPPLPRLQHSLLGPSQTSYYAPLVPPRVPRVPDIPLLNSQNRRPPPILMPAPWMQPSLAQFPGPLRLAHPGYPLDSNNYAGYGDPRGLHPSGASSVSSMTSDSLTPSLASSPLPLGDNITESNGSSGQRLPMVRAESWTAHFESLPPVPRKAKRSRAQHVEKENARVMAQMQYDYQSAYPSYVLMHQCPLCPRAFERRNGLAIHLKWHYKPDEPVSPDLYTASADAAGEPDSSPSLSVGSAEASAGSSSLLVPQCTGGYLGSDHGPITPLATPPPSPTAAKDSSADSSMDSSRGSNRSHSRIWPELFGSDD